MKRVLAFVLCLIITLTCMGTTVNAWADGKEIDPTGIFELTAQSGDYKVGDLIEVKIYAHDYVFCAMDCLLDYDRKVFQELDSSLITYNNLSASGESVRLDTEFYHEADYAYNGKVCSTLSIMEQEGKEVVLSKDGYVGSLFFEVKTEFTETTINIWDAYLITEDCYEECFENISCTIEGDKQSGLVIKGETESLRAGDTVSVNVYMKETGFSYFETYIEYDTEVFEELKASDIVMSEVLTSGNYGEWTKTFSKSAENKMTLSEESGCSYVLPENGLFVTINFTVAKETTETEITFASPAIVTAEVEDYSYEDVTLKVKEVGRATVWLGGKAVKLTTALQPTKWKDAAGKTKSGTITWIVKNEPTEIEFNTTTHKVITKSDTNLTTVSKGSVKGKAVGCVYVYAADTGSMTTEKFVVDVKAAPTTVVTYYDAEVTSDTIKYTSDTVPEGESVKLYYKGIVGSVKKNNWEILTDKDLTYTLTVPEKYKDYITVTEDTDKDYFEVTVKEGLIQTFSKNGKALAVSLSLKNDQTGKKTTFKVVVSNPVNTVTLESGEDTTATVDESGMLTVVLESAKTAVQSGFIEETTVLYNESGTRTDSTKIVRIPHPEQYGFSTTGTITSIGKTTSEQNKVSIAAVKGQPGVYKVTAKKGTQPGTEAYFVLWHNSFGRSAGTGFQLVKVVVGTANHVETMNLEKKNGEAINAEVNVTAEENSNDILVTMPSGKTAKQIAYLTETITLENEEESTEGTDYNTIYKLPCGTEDAFTIAKNGLVTVNGPLTANQKKVSMTAVKKATGEYTITAAKGTAEGTEAYFLLYHNPETWSIISVVVGTPNKVTKSELSTSDANLVLTTEDLDNGRMTVVTVPYSAKKQTFVLTECVILPADDEVATDVTKVVRIAEEDAYEVALNKSTVTAVGTLSADQKKISMALKKKTTDTFTLTVAAKTPEETATYFIIYHNSDNIASGTGYHIVKVVVTGEEKTE